MYAFTAFISTIVIGVVGTSLGSRINFLEFGLIAAIATIGAFICHALTKKA